MSCLQALKEREYRITPQRAVILEALHQAEGHITAEDIYSRVQAKYPEINKSTVYRTLELLKKLGLVVETDLGGDRLHYHHIEKVHHHHLICQRCGKVTDADEGLLTPLKELLTRNYDFLPHLRHLAIFGRCMDCRVKEHEGRP